MRASSPCSASFSPSASAAGSSFAMPLPRGARASIEHGGITYQVTSVAGGKAIARANEAVARVREGRARMRVVLDVGSPAAEVSAGAEGYYTPAALVDPCWAVTSPDGKRLWSSSFIPRSLTLYTVDAAGRLFNGDEVLYLMVAERLARGEPVPGAVGTLMTNMAVEVALKSRGVQFVRAKVGDRYVLEELEKNRWLLGGEGSGHLLALDKHTTGDGLISALQVLQACVRSGRSLAELLADVTLFPQTLINVRLRPDQDWKSNALLASETRAVEAELGAAGRVLIRASGTEPLLRVMVEARDAAQAQASAQRLADAVRAG